MQVVSHAADAGTGRCRLVHPPAAEWALVETTAGLDFACRVSRVPPPWSSRAYVAVDALIWRRRPDASAGHWDAQECVATHTLVASSVRPITDARVADRLVFHANAPQWRRMDAQTRHWAVALLRELVGGVVVSVGWRVRGGAALGTLEVVSACGVGGGDGAWWRVDAVASSVEVVVVGSRAVRLDAATMRVGGMDELLEQLHALVVRDKRHALLHGLSGCGKTLAVRALCGRHALPLWCLDGRQLSVADVADTFDEAADGVVLIDNADSVPSVCMGALLAALDAATSRRVCVLGTTCQLELVDAALRRPGRMDADVVVRAPLANERAAIVAAHCAGRCEWPADVGERTVGMTGADLQRACREARHEGWDVALARSRAALRGVVEETPHKAWDDIGGLENVKKRLQQAIAWPLLHADRMAALGLHMARGVLLHGPPGCAKTSLVRALATNLHATFFVLSAASVYSPWVGAAEAAVRDTFARARNFPPAIVFIDELEAVVGKRGTNASDGGDGGTRVQERVLSTLLNEMDGIEQTRSVVVVGATNRVDRIDDALLRPGRFDYVVEVPLPDVSTRRAILQVYARRMPLAPEVDLDALAAATEGYSGAQLEALCNEAAMQALRAAVQSGHAEDTAAVAALVVQRHHFGLAT